MLPDHWLADLKQTSSVRKAFDVQKPLLICRKWQVQRNVGFTPISDEMQVTLASLNPESTKSRGEI